MRIDDSAYSRTIAWLRILLPLTALGILSTMFLVARQVTPAQDLPYTDIDIAEMAREQRVGGPTFTGVTRDGIAITVAAASAAPDLGGTSITGRDVTASFELPDDGDIRAKANLLRMNYADRTISLTDDVEIHSHHGYVLRTQGINVRTETLEISSHTKTTVDGPLGQFSAGSFSIMSRSNSGDALVMVFKNRVELIYTPQRSGEP